MLANYVQPGTSYIGSSQGFGQPAVSLFNLTFRSSATTPRVALFGPSEYPFGSGFEFPFGEVGIFDISHNNSTGFAEISNVLTSGNDEFVEFLQFIAPTGGGFGVGGMESAVFGGLLTGDTIDFFRLIVASNQLQSGFNQLIYAPRFEWQIWGRGPTVLPPKLPGPTIGVYEPTTLWLFVLSLIAILIVTRRST